MARVKLPTMCQVRMCVNNNNKIRTANYYRCFIGTEQNSRQKYDIRVSLALGNNHYMPFGWWFLISLQTNIKSSL